MPLSEHEQKVLEQMEQALYAEDPRFAHQMVGQTRARAQRRRAALGILLALGGLGLIVLGVLISQIWVGGLGFGAMVLGGAWTFTPPRAKPALSTVDAEGNLTLRTGHPSMGQGGKGAGQAKAGRTKKGRSSGSFMQRMEQRWDHRKEQGPS